MKQTFKLAFSGMLILCFIVSIKFTGKGVSINHNNIIASVNSAMWSDIPESNITLKGDRQIKPLHYRTLKVNYNELKSDLSNAPFEFSARAKMSPFIIALPLPEGGFSRFYVTEYSMMEPGLNQKYPDVRTYTIKGIDDVYATGKIDITMNGFHAMILTVKGNYFIDPYSTNEKEIYISYYKRDYAARESFECYTEDLINDNNGYSNTFGTITCGAQLRTYRLALAATGEYTTFHGGTVPQGMSAIVTAMNRINGVYETDFCVRMVLIANNDTLVYTNASTDPYTNSNGGQMLGQNQTNLDNVIGPDNYDIGHVFSTGGGGVAFLSCVCSNGAKARGVTGLNSPIGDPFYIDYVAHEMGHQFGGNHSFNSSSGACGGGNRNPSTAWEPGSGSTIMSYAGICGGHNLQPHSDAYFHSGNFQEMIIFTQFGAGTTCPVITATGNTPPTVTVPTGGFTIPISTPFKLTGSASDSESQNSLTYCWEEMDLGPAGGPNAPSGSAPIFRSFNPDTSATRIFPKLSSLLSNTQVTGEILPTYTRTLTFRLTVRDNSAVGGGVNYEDMTPFEVTADAGPFLVTQPNTNVTWNANDPQTVTWDVANTTAAPVSCANVNIQLSIDSGLTYPTTLAANTPNDGSQIVTLPLINNSKARIKVEAVGNIFFDISNTNFTISKESSVSTVGTGIPERFNLSQNFPNPFNPATKINFDVPGRSNVVVKIMDLSGREVSTPVNGNYEAGFYSLTFDALNLASGIYVYKIYASGDKGNFVMTKKMTLIK